MKGDTETDIVGFVAQLLAEIAATRLEPFDITTLERAQETVEKVEELRRKLQRLQRIAEGLRRVSLRKP
jgi:hypothetical protein